MEKLARKALKGYGYQVYLFGMFVSMMDADRKIISVETEATDTLEFDDLYIRMRDGESYRVQVKNKMGLSEKDIKVWPNVVQIGNDTAKYSSKDNNILICKSLIIKCNHTFMGFPACVKNGITIVPITEKQIEDKLDELFFNYSREALVINTVLKNICASVFSVTVNDLPEIERMSTKLSLQTVSIRAIPEEIRKGVTFCYGKPGIGKSHYVCELQDGFPNALIYRFWVDSQDKLIEERLRYDVFIAEIGQCLFSASGKRTVDEIIAKLSADDRILIIDGFDHVENYRQREVKSFMTLFEKLNNFGIRTLVLSRYLREPIPWESYDLANWNHDETCKYLEAAHGINDYCLQNEIFEVSSGYPIIVRYLAEHYLKYHEIIGDVTIAGTEQFYEKLLDNVNTKKSLSVFATNNSFYTWEELREIIGADDYFDILKEFVNYYPYLFEIVANRVSLIHDSFNLFLRRNIPAVSERLEKTKRIVKDSIMSGSVEYFSRLSSFDFDEDFLAEVVRKYSSFSEFEKLLKTTLDYNSISDLYVQLQLILEDHNDWLDVYQLYSFALIFQIATRNDLIGCDGLAFQILKYIEIHGCVEETVYSSGIMWNMYLAGKGKNDAERYLANLNYSESQYEALVQAMEEESHFFDRLTNRIEFSELEKQFANANMGIIEREQFLEDYLVSIWVHGEQNAFLYREFHEYILKDNTSELSISIMMKGLLPQMWIPQTLRRARRRLHELGLFGESNEFRGSSLKSIICKVAPEGSFEVIPTAQSYIRLVNYERRETDILSVNYVWSMYGQRKDYSVFTMDSALIAFEKHGLLEETKSLELIKGVMGQSEKGIKHLLYEYINIKGPEYVSRLITGGILTDGESLVDVFDLSSEGINRLPRSIIRDRIEKMVKKNLRWKEVDIDEIDNVLKSIYADMVLSALDYHEIRICGQVHPGLADMLTSKGFDVERFDNQNKPRRPFEDGYIVEEDVDVILRDMINPLEVASYVNGNGCCLPFPLLYSHFSRQEISRDYLNILHKAMFARYPGGRHLGEWALLLGNIPAFLDSCDVCVDWTLLFHEFESFLRISLIA